MKLLHIDTSILGDHSVSRQVSAAIVERLRKEMPGLEVIYRPTSRSRRPSAGMHAPSSSVKAAISPPPRVPSGSAATSSRACCAASLTSWARWERAGTIDTTHARCLALVLVDSVRPAAVQSGAAMAHHQVP